MAVALVTAAVSLVPMACGGDEAAMRATLTNDGCTYDGDTSPTAGVVTIDVENQTEFSRAFGIVSIAEGSTVDDLQRALDQYPRQFEKDGTLPERPDFYALWSLARIEAGASGPLSADVPAGTYAVVCFVDDDLPTEKVYIAEQLDVTSTGRPIRPPSARPLWLQHAAAARSRSDTPVRAACARPVWSPATPSRSV
jgi:hypothetical protein